VSLDYLGLILQDRGNYTEAEASFRESLALFRKALGEEHPEVATSLSNLGLLLLERGEYVAAEARLREALALKRKLLGPEHPDVAPILNNLAKLLQDRGTTPRRSRSSESPWPSSALTWVTRIRPLRRASTISHGSFSIEGLRGSGAALSGSPCHVPQAVGRGTHVCGGKHEQPCHAPRRPRDYASAEPLYRESLAMLRKLLGEEHPYVAGSLNNLAQLLHTLGDYTGEEPLYRESLAILRKTFGEEHPNIATSLNNLAISYQSGGLRVRGAALPRSTRHATQAPGRGTPGGGEEPQQPCRAPGRAR